MERGLVLLRSRLKGPLIPHMRRAHSLQLRHQVVVEAQISDTHVGNSGQT